MLSRFNVSECIFQGLLLNHIFHPIYTHCWSLKFIKSQCNTRRNIYLGLYVQTHFLSFVTPICRPRFIQAYSVRNNPFLSHLPSHISCLLDRSDVSNWSFKILMALEMEQSESEILLFSCHLNVYIGQESFWFWIQIHNRRVRNLYQRNYIVSRLKFDNSEINLLGWQ
jgi:hypothetical protein